MTDKNFKVTKKKKRLSTKRIIEGVIIGLLVAGVVALVSLLIAMVRGGDRENGGGNPAGSSGEATPSESSEPIPTTPTPTITISTSTPTPVPDTTLETFDISLERDMWGKDIGPNRYQLSDQHNKVYVIYGWDAVMSDGTENDSESCEIVGSVAGPQRLASYLTNECSYGGGSSIGNPNETVLDISVPGDYTVTVKDKLTGVTGSATFQVIE